MDQDATWYGDRPWPRPHCGTQRPSTESGRAAPHFLAHIYCGQTAGWIRIPLGTEVALGPGDVVLDGDPASPVERGTAAPHFSAHVYCG